MSTLTRNDKVAIESLTKFAEHGNPQDIVDCIVTSPKKDLLMLYTMDSIIKNVGGKYIEIFQDYVVRMFESIFKLSDTETREKMFKLRHSVRSYPTTHYLRLTI